MGRDVCGVFEHGRREPREMPAAFAEACGELGARWGVKGDATGIVGIDVEEHVVIVKPGPRWLGFAELGDFRELCRVITWAVGVAYDRRSPVLFVTDSFVCDAPPEDFDRSLAWVQHCEGPSADPFWASRYAHLFGRPTGAWLLDPLYDIDVASPMAGYRSIIDGFHARGGMRMSSSNDKNEYVCVWAEDIVGRDVRVHVRADGVDEDAPIWSGLLDAIVAVGDFVDGTKFHQFRDIYSGNTIGDDPIAAAIDHACTLRDARVALSLIGFDVRSAEIVVTEEQVRRLAQVGGSLQISVGLSGSD